MAARSFRRGHPGAERWIPEGAENLVHGVFFISGLFRAGARMQQQALPLAPPHAANLKLQAKNVSTRTGWRYA